MATNNFLFITNFKTYTEASGVNAEALLKIHDEVAGEFPHVNVTCAVQALDFGAVSDFPNVKKLAQHVDPACAGSYTGKIVPERVKNMGGWGTILNHSENRLEREVLKESITSAKRSGLVTIVCCETAEEGWSFLEFEPDYLAVEPPELIGGDISISKSQADVIKKALELIGGDKLLVGAGVRDFDDVRIAVEYGARGVLVASGVCKAADPAAALRDLLSGYPVV